MVQKSSHRGVHSGNTLRASNSRYSRRYHSQACIVSRVCPDLLRKLQDLELTEAEKADKNKPLRNVAVGVALSLNKQARWSLPSALIRQIHTNNIADGDLTVSVLERHKLKRPANCISFHTNKGQTRRVQPQNGRYIGFNFPRADGKSNRALRREKREEVREAQIGEKKLSHMKGKTVEVFTEQGRAKSTVGLGESEVRYEVFYPAPASSSLAHNPKYIRTGDTESPPGVDIQQHVQHGKPRKSHSARRRHRITLKDMDDWELAFCPSSSSSYSPSSRQVASPSLTTVPCGTLINPQQLSTLRSEVPAEERDATEFLLTALIEKAQRLRDYKGSPATKPRKKNNRANCCTVNEYNDNKSHIVYLDQSDEHSLVEDQRSEKSRSPTTVPISSPVPSECARVLLSKEDVSEGSLRESFGEGYTEVGCQPRKFVLDVTGSVRELLKKHGVSAKVSEQTEEAVTFLVCVHDGFYDDDCDVYKVLVNSRLHDGGLLSVETPEDQGLLRGTVMYLVSRSMDVLQGLIPSLRDNKHFPLFLHVTSNRRRHLDNHLGSSEAYVPSVQRHLQLESGSSTAVSDASSVPRSTWDLLQEEPVFCDVCYDDVSPLTFGSASSTSLLSCRHRVCDACWSQHIHTRCQEGFVRVTCPGYDCQHDAPLGLLLSLAPLSTVHKLLTRQEEVRIGGSPTEKWCPNQTCGRVISLKTSSSSSSFPGAPQELQQDVVCACGVHVCFQCLLPAHWPSSCQQAEVYRATDSAGLPDRLAEIHDDNEAEALAREKRRLQEKKTLIVEGKFCPRCKNFVYKDGGCPQMTCRCGQEFCWFCGKAGLSHPSRFGCLSVQKEKEITTTFIVHHLDEESNGQKQQAPAAAAKGRQRVSLMERAVEHRKQREHNKTNSRAISSLAKAAATAGAKDKGVRQQLYTACNQAFPAAASSASTSTLVDTALTFLRSVDHSRQELLEVMEHSWVMLKDLPDSLLRRRALRITEDLSAFCSFSQSVLDVWSRPQAAQSPLQEAVRAVERLAEIQRWVHAALDRHVVTVRKLRSMTSTAQ